jgi:hypothetical protein
MEKKNITLPQHLLWEYNLENFNYEKSYKVVIERVIERGDLEEWKLILDYYGSKKVEEVAAWSKQLSIKDKKFTTLLIQSGYINAL